MLKGCTAVVFAIKSTLPTYLQVCLTHGTVIELYSMHVLENKSYKSYKLHSTLSINRWTKHGHDSTDVYQSAQIFVKS